MTLDEAKEQFVQTWGTLGATWGINRTMAQLHALLLVSDEALSAKEIEEKLDISRGNISMSIRELISWGLVFKEIKTGDRKEYFYAEKDMWEVFKCIVRERKKRELDPILKAIDNLAEIEGEKDDTAFTEFSTVVKDIQGLTNSADKILNRLTVAEKNWFIKTLMKLFT